MNLIKYYDMEGTVIQTEYSTDTKAELTDRLNDNNVEQACEFDQFDITASDIPDECSKPADHYTFGCNCFAR